MPKENAPMLPGFQCESRGRKRLSIQSKLSRLKIKEKSSNLWEFESFFSSCFSNLFLLKSNKTGHNSRRRVYTTSVTFWAFLMQVMTKNSSCQESVYRVQSWFVNKKLEGPISSNTAAYVKARKRLKLSFLFNVFKQTRNKIVESSKETSLWYGRRIKVIDGTAVSMPDTKENQEKWPQSKSQAVGCGFPLMNLCAIFCLKTGIVLDWKIGDKHNTELKLWARLWKRLKKGDILLGDRAYCTYSSIALLKDRGIDHLVRLRGETQIKWKNTTKIGKGQWLYQWKKPIIKVKSLTQEEWESIPDILQVRIIKVKFKRKGFRTEEPMILTTLCDDKEYPVEDIVALYYRRWDVELNFRDIKTTLEMDILTCKTPREVVKELMMHMISYNLIQSKMIEASKHLKKPIKRISFNGTRQAIKHYMILSFSLSCRKIRTELHTQFLEKIGHCLIPYRKKERIEPRARKRRPRTATRLNKPRDQMREEIVNKSNSKKLYPTPRKRA